MKHQLTENKIITEKHARKLLRTTMETMELAISTGKNLHYINDHYLFAIAYHTGLRVSELLDLTWDDISDDSLLVRNGKGNKKRSVVFGPKTKEFIDNFRNIQQQHLGRECAPDTPLFLGQRGRLGRVGAHLRLKHWVNKLGLPKSLSLHSFRHGYATRLLNEGIPLHSVKEQLGHSNIAVTSTYLHFTDEAKDKLKKVL